MGIVTHMLLSFLISIKCGTQTHTWISNNLPIKDESLLHWYISPRPEAFSTMNTPYVPSFILIGHTHLNLLLGKLSIQGLYCTCMSRSPRIIIVSNIIDGSIEERIHQETTPPMRPESNPHKGLTSLPTQNLKAISLWVLFLIRFSTFSSLPNVELRFTFAFSAVSPLKGESLPHWYSPLRVETFLTTIPFSYHCSS